MNNTETKNWNNFFLGLAVALLPFIGLPGLFKQIIFLALGLLIALFSLARLGRSPAQPKVMTSHDSQV